MLSVAYLLEGTKDKNGGNGSTAMKVGLALGATVGALRLGKAIHKGNKHDLEHDDLEKRRAELDTRRADLDRRQHSGEDVGKEIDDYNRDADSLNHEVNHHNSVWSQYHS